MKTRVTLIPLSGIKMMVLFFSTMMWMKAQSQQYYEPLLGLPYVNTLNKVNGAIPAGISPDEATVTDNNGVQLTEDITQKRGAFYMTDARFNTKNGIHIEFEYSSNSNKSGAGGDGISMILYNGNGNGTAGGFNLGASGAGLGYTYTRRDGNYSKFPNLYSVEGVHYGYLALGLDEYGNYKKLRNSGFEYREGIVDPTNAYPGTDWADNSNHVTLRGPGNPDTTHGSGTDANGNVIYPWFSGYSVLYTASTDKTSGTYGTKYSAQLNTGDGSYSFSPNPVVPANRSFTLATSAANPVWDQSDANYRKVFVDIVPLGSTNEMKIYVSIQHGTLRDTVINGYPLPNDFITTIDNTTTNGVTNIIDAKIPQYLNIAFAASTGSNVNNHYIRNLSIYTPFAASAQPDTLYFCSNSASLSCTSFNNILANDSAYAGSFTENSLPVASPDNIDVNSFAFSTDSLSVNIPNTIDANGVTATNADGTWYFDYQTEEVTFTPAPDNTTKEGKIFYSIKGKSAPYNSEAYRSAGIAITVLKTTTAPAEVITQQSDITSFISNNHSQSGQSFSFSMMPAGGGATGLKYSAIGLPSSLQISDSGRIYGTAPQKGTYKFVVTLQSATGCNDVQELAMSFSAADPLPVTYSAPLKATVINNAVRLDWKTATENNNKHFIIERSTDRITWRSIGSVESFFPTGTGSEHAYSHIDGNPLPGNNFYRLQQVDINGNVKLSSIVNVSFIGNNAIMYVSPNPAKEHIKIHHLPANALVRIVSINGNVYTLPMNDGSMNVSRLPAGIYFVQISVSNSVIAKLEFVKQ
jgi:hypothetical protein